MLDALAGIVDQWTDARSHVPFKCVVFARSDELAQDVRRFFGGRELMFIEVLFQPPAFGSDLIVWLWSVSGETVTGSRLGNVLRVAQEELEWYSITCNEAAETANGKGDSNVSREIAQEFSNAWSVIRNSTGSACACDAEVVRTWIFVPDINGAIDGRSTYQELNRARREAFALDYPECNHATRQVKYPASTGIGTCGEKLHLSALACRRSGAVTIRSIENPRQQSAFAYSSDVSPVVPLFSRAVLVSGEMDALLVVSGTASIAGEHSVHPQSASRQARKSLENIASLVECALGGAAVRPLHSLRQCSVYIRNLEHAAEVRQVCRELLEPETAVVYVAGDICRPELLVEIEAIAMFPREAAARRS